MENLRVLQVKSSEKLFAVCGCTHGELDLIYRSIDQWEARYQLKISFLLCCGDFEAIRDEFDLD